MSDTESEITASSGGSSRTSVKGVSSKIRNRGWCFTLNNYCKADLRHLRDNIGYMVEDEDEVSNVKYLIFGKEKGKKGTKHLQGYIEFENAVGMLYVKETLDSNTVHLEPRLGTPAQAADYCKKEERWEEFGQCPRQGKRSDLDAVVALVESGINLREIASALPIQFIKYCKGITCLYHLRHEHRTWKPNIKWFWGLAGRGKSYAARQGREVDEIFIKDGTKWWGSYNYEERVIIDDFDPKESGFDYRIFLRLLDEGKFEGEFKNGYINITAKEIFITSEFPPEHFWRDNKLEQVTSRIDEIIEIRGPNRRAATVRRVQVN